jgi:sugar lactone lactonase YvrE
MVGRARKETAKTAEAGLLKEVLGGSRGASLAGFGLILLCLITGSALADDSPAQDFGLPTSEQFIDAIESEGQHSPESLVTDPSAAEGLPRQDLGREEALDLLQGVFEAHLQAPAGIFDDLEVEKFLSPNVAVIAGSEPATYVSDAPQAEAQDAADAGESEPSASMAMKEELREQSSSAGEEPEVSNSGPERSGRIAHATLLQSSIPLATETSSGEPEAVDLGLENAEGELQPENPLVEVGIPQQLGEGIELPEAGVTIKIAGAPADRSSSIVDGSVAFMPNVAPDTDLVIAPTPTGVETFTQLRSADSPRSQTYVLELPSGAALRATEAGGAVVVQEEKTLVGISPPTAIDATGADVPVSLDVSGNAFTLTVAPDDSAVLPILVDPLIQTYEWASSTPLQNGICSNSSKYEGPSFSCINREEWGYEWSKGTTGIQLQDVEFASDAVPSRTPGLVLNSSETLTAGDRGSMIYTVPRYFTDQTKYGARPTSFISHMTLWNLDWAAHSSSLSPYLFAGIWDPFKPGWVSYFSHEGLSGHGIHDMSWMYQFSNGQPNTNAKVGYVSIQATSTGPGQNTHAYVGSASMQLSDNGVPGFGSIGGPSSWVNQSSLPISFTVSDNGLGVHALTARIERLQEPAITWKTPYGCIGVSGAACPRTWASTDVGPPALKYEPSVMPSGISYLEVVAEDPVGNKSAPAYAQVKVDHTAPQVFLSGTMTEQASLGPKRPAYTLRVDASDGTLEKPQSGVAKTVIKVDGATVDQVSPGCTTKNCAISREWTLESSKYSAGQHTVTVTATDAVGIATTKTLTITLNPSPPTLALSGTMTEQATLGASRPRYKLKASASAQAGLEGSVLGQPTFASSFGSAGTASGQFNHPAGVAVDLNGNLWVVDQGNDRVVKFSESGQYLSSFGSPGTGNGQFGRPTSIAIDASGNLWVTDAANNRVEKFSASGAYLAQFGTYGAGNGQLSNPEGIAIDPKGNIWVADTYNGRLQQFNANGQFLKVVSSKGTAQGQLGEPTDLDVDAGGNVWVTDWLYNRVAMFDQAGQFVRQFGSYGGGNGQLNHPDVIDVDSAGNVWVGDQSNSRVQAFSPSGEYLAKFGSYGSGQGQFNFEWPMGLATDSKGRIWVADTANNRVQRWQIPGYAPAYASALGSLGTGNMQFNHPADATVDNEGNIWVVDSANNRVQKLDALKGYVAQFGSAGSGDGQLNAPSGIAHDAEGNLWVVDTGNNRVQKFNEKGEYLAQFGSYGTGPGQFKAPAAIAVHQESGAIFVGDRGNHRIQRFTKDGAYYGQSGAFGSGDGWYISPNGIAIGGPAGGFGYSLLVADGGNNRVQRLTPTGAFLGKFGSSGSGAGQLDRPGAVEVDSMGNVWVGDQNNSRVQKFTQNGELLTQFGSSGSGAGQFSLSWPMGIAIDSKGTLLVTDTQNNRIQLWNQSNWRSEINTEISVDGVLANSGKAGCTAANCSIARDWTLNSSAYAPGQHTVVVKASDGLGNTTTKSLTVNIQRDTTKPTLQAGGELVEAPEGWVEQESYGLNASAADGGYGVSSLAFKIDGKQVASVGQACVDGGCEQSLTKSLDMSTYEGGAHPAELVATDGAGNTAVKSWRINVDPEGHISTEEAVATLEAVQATSPVNVVGEAQEIEDIEGTVSGLGVADIEDAIETTGSHVPSTISSEPGGGAVMEVLEAGALASPCLSESESITEEEAPESEALEPCYEQAELDDGTKDFELEAAEIVQATVAPQANQNKIVDSAVVLSANTVGNVDTITRPLYDGLLTFAAIRDRTASESYSWEVNLTPDQELKLIDPQHAAVYYSGGYPAISIRAEPAHDATGLSVPTLLSVSEGNVVTLTVNHRAANYVYPVVAGAGWQGGFRTQVIEIPLDELQEQERKEAEERQEREWLEAEEEGIEFGPTPNGDYRYSETTFGPPVSGSGSVPLVAAQPSSVKPTDRAYNFVECRWTSGQYPAPPGVKMMREVQRGCHGEGESTSGNTHIVKWAVSMSGNFHYKYGHWVWVTEHPRCRKWGQPLVQPSIVHCRYENPNPSNVRVNVVSHLRFGPNDYVPIRSTCAEFNGVLPVRPENQRPYYGKIHFSYEPVWPDDNCPWGNFESPAGH